MAPVLQGKKIGWDQKTLLKGELLIWRTKNQAGDQVHSNSRIQFGSHESKLGPRKLDLGPLSQVGLMVFYRKTLLTPYVENHCNQKKGV
jgi:hypothetical protein